MKRKRKLDTSGAAFVMEAGDRFHRIIVSDSVKYESDPNAETVIAFFVIRRASGKFDVCNVLRTFSKGKPVSRSFQNKPNVPAAKISDEIDAIRICFALAIEKATGLKLRWHELDLSGIESLTEQADRIKAWGRLNAWTTADAPMLN
jgi:hypothetical protein